MAKKEFKTTERGFKLYGEVEDSRGCVVRVQESSVVGRPHAYLFTDDVQKVYRDGHPHPHLTVAQAMELVVALENFVRDATDDDNWRNDPKYAKEFG